MQEGFSVSTFLPDEAATTRLANRIAPKLRSGDTLLLEGSIGAGKTHFARAVIQHRMSNKDRPEEVPSPTYTLVQTYNDGQTEIWHADLYRLADVSEISELALDEAIGSALVLIEWPDRMAEAPYDALLIRFQTEKDGRRLTFSSASSRWKSLGNIVRDRNA